MRKQVIRFDLIKEENAVCAYLRIYVNMERCGNRNSKWDYTFARCLLGGRYMRQRVPSCWTTLGYRVQRNNGRTRSNESRTLRWGLHLALYEKRPREYRDSLTTSLTYLCQDFHRLSNYVWRWNLFDRAKRSFYRGTTIDSEYTNRSD